MSLEDATRAAFAGVLAITPEVYEKKMQWIAQVTGLELDDDLRKEVHAVMESWSPYLD